MQAFKLSALEDAFTFYNTNGFVRFTGLLTQGECDSLASAYQEARASGALNYDPKKMANNNDSIYRHKVFENTAKHPAIVQIVHRLFGHRAGIELQHSKFNDKPPSSDATIEWHQDYPFFPHTNFDLLACTIHMDDEDEAKGPLVFIPGSHKWPVLTHLADGKFAYRITEGVDTTQSAALTCKAWDVTFHHCLSLHASEQNRSSSHRRHLIYQYRAEDAVQLAGVLWQCTGYTVRDGGRKGYARFPDGTSVEMRGKEGRLIDLFGALAPDRTPDFGVVRKTAAE